jgi:FtsZ-interacting cell division protein ZipA
MKSRQVQLIVLGVAVVALVVMVLRSTRQDSSASDEAARLVRGPDLDDDSPIEDSSTVQRERPKTEATPGHGRLGGSEPSTNEAASESAEEDKSERKTKRDRPKRSGRRKTAANSEQDDTPTAKPNEPKVKISGKRITRGGS